MKQRKITRANYATIGQIWTTLLRSSSISSAESQSGGRASNTMRKGIQTLVWQRTTEQGNLQRTKYIFVQGEERQRRRSSAMEAEPRSTLLASRPERQLDYCYWQCGAAAGKLRHNTVNRVRSSRYLQRKRCLERRPNRPIYATCASSKRET